jgi:hypothetical protein
VPSSPIVASSLSIVTVKLSSDAVAVILSLALEVAAVYSRVWESNSGVKVIDPIASVERVVR